MSACAVHRVDQILDVATQPGTEVGSHHGFEFGQRLETRLDLWVRVGADRLLDSCEPAEDLGLHHQHGLQQLIGFGHVVVAPVDCVATTTLAGDGMAFYSRGGGA